MAAMAGSAVDRALAGRRAAMRSTTPVGYRWQRHVALVATFVVAGLCLSVRCAGGLTASDLPLLVPMVAALVLGEYASHRWSMHRRAFPTAIHHRHVVEHHGFFTFDAMAIESWNDLRWVLFPWWAMPLLVVAVLPTFAALHALASPHVAWLFLFSVMAYYGVYEVVHALAHLPADHPVAGRASVRALTWHHRVHHDPRLMDRRNFSFVVPILDRVFRTAADRPG